MGFKMIPKGGRWGWERGEGDILQIVRKCLPFSSNGRARQQRHYLPVEQGTKPNLIIYLELARPSNRFIPPPLMKCVPPDSVLQPNKHL